MSDAINLIKARDEANNAAGKFLPQVIDTQVTYTNAKPKREPEPVVAPVLPPMLDDKAAKLEAMLNARGIDTSPHHPVWTEEQMEIRRQCTEEVYGQPKQPLQKLESADSIATISEAEARENLRTAIGEKKNSDKELMIANEVLERARAKVVEIGISLGEYRNLDSDVLAHNVAAMRAGTHEELPHSLAYRLAERSKLTDRSDHAARVLAQLQNEHRIAELQSVQAKYAVAQAAVVVIATSIEDKVRAILEAEALARQLRIELLSYDATWFPLGASPTRAGVTHQVVALLRDPPCNSNTLVDPVLVQELLQTHAGLCSNHEAEL